jgi:phospholipid/cholesterol/gamma-HCH transport system substrate-binding protein
MRALIKDNVVEALIGLVVVLVAVGFVGFAWDRTQAGTRGGGYVVKARFSNVAGVTPGTDVRIAGIKVGQVTASALDPQSYEANLEITLDKTVKLPTDSSAAITSEGLLGGNYIALTPGGDTAMIQPGGEITETSGSTDLMALVGQAINRTGDSGTAPAASPAAASAPAK